MAVRRKQKPFSGAKPEFCSAAEEEKSSWKKRKGVIWVERMGMIWGGQQRTLICEKNKRAKVVIFNYIRKRHEEVATYPLGSLLTSSSGRLWF